MKKILHPLRAFLLVFNLLILNSFCNAQNSEEAKILVFSKTAGFQHSSIPQGNKTILTLGAENGIKVDTTTNADLFTKKNLEKYNAVVFLNTTGNILTSEQQESFEHYIQTGGGFVGVHAASDTEYDWPWYGELVGAYFLNHPEVQEAEIEVVISDHPSTAHLPIRWKRTDEWYNFTNLNPDVHLLLKLNEESYEGGENGDPHPIAWYHRFQGGRSFYTALGHTRESYSEPLFLEHLLGGIYYAIGRQ